MCITYIEIVPVLLDSKPSVKESGEVKGSGTLNTKR